MANPRYKIVNASNDLFNGISSKGDAMVQPATRRVVELDEELSEGRIALFASSGIFIKKTTEAAQNNEPLPGMDPDLAMARNRLMLVAGQERQDLIDSLWDEGGSKSASKSSAKSSGANAGGDASSSATTAAPSTTAAAQGATATATPAASAGTTSTAGR